MSKNNRRGTIPIDSVKEDFYVRTHLNNEHVLQLAVLYEKGAKLPPIVLAAEGNKLIDGRHRLEALRMLERKSVDVEWIEESDTSMLMVHALRANIGGALPPTNSDIVLALKQMLGAGMPYSVVQKQFTNIWPPAVTRKYLDDARWAINRDKIANAKSAIIEKNMTVGEAALAFGVKADTLKDALGSKKSRKSSIATYKSIMTTTFRKRGAAVGALLKKAQVQYEDGDLSWGAIEELLEAWEASNKSSARSLADWRKRLTVTSQKRAKAKTA